MNIETTSPFFTVFTPVFNGEKHLHRVFKSIAEQTFRDFEWIIINDGSTDNSATLIRSFLAEHPEIDAKYLEQANSGKHISWNRAVEIARGRLFVPADADDYFFPETLSYFFEEWNKLTPVDKAILSGINVLCFDNDSEDVVGDIFPADGMRTTNVELEFGHKLQGEKWGCVRTDMLKSRPFPIIKGSHFPESYIWYHFSKKYKVICFNKPLRRYFTTETGIMQHELKKVYNPAQDRINIKYYLWLLRNFGIFILLHSPVVFVQSVKILFKSVLKSLLR
jgi:glycosyltransferase involved in cell wall biosynthesis